jgi:hypothetical protein
MKIVHLQIVSFQDQLSNEGEGQPNVVEVPISVIVLDENDNPPNFRGTPYKAAVNEDTPVGTTVFRALEAVDADQVFYLVFFEKLAISFFTKTTTI